MNITRLLLCAALAAVPIVGLPHAFAGVFQEPPRDDRGANAPSVDVALLLDTSNSMDGLINQAKGQLWSIVQQFANARRDGRAPTLRVALFEYGNTNLPASEGYIRQVVPLTSDLDKLSEALFSLSTNGGDEYCGHGISEAVKRLDWSRNDGAYKAIFIAGNEPFTQGETDYRAACGRAVAAGVIVNTIHCCNRTEGISTMWQDGAMLGKGAFFNIDQDRRLPDIRCPQDEPLMRLNSSLNETYLWYGKADDRGAMEANQRAQDSNASELGGAVASQRAAAKAGGGYQNRGRDLVDTYEEDPAILEKLKDEELPEAMHKMTPDEREAHVKGMAAERAALKADIGKLAAEREAHYTAELKKLQAASGSTEQTLGEAVNAAVREQLSEAGYKVESPATQPSTRPGRTPE